MEDYRFIEKIDNNKGKGRYYLFHGKQSSFGNALWQQKGQTIKMEIDGLIHSLFFFSFYFQKIN